MFWFLMLETQLWRQQMLEVSSSGAIHLREQGEFFGVLWFGCWSETVVNPVGIAIGQFLYFHARVGSLGNRGHLHLKETTLGCH